MITLNEHDKRVLANVGHGAYGREFVEIIEKVRKQLCSLEDLKPGTDHNTEVEGRILFKAFADVLIERMKFEQKPRTSAKPEGRADLS